MTIEKPQETLKCQHINIIFDDRLSERVCSDCGMVIEKVFVESQYTLGSQKRLAYQNRNFQFGEIITHMKSKGTNIGFQDGKVLKDINGHFLSPANNSIYKRLQKIDRRKIRREDQSLYEHLKWIKPFVDRFQITSIVIVDTIRLYNDFIAKINKKVTNRPLIFFTCLVSILKSTPRYKILKLKDLIEFGNTLSTRITYSRFSQIRQKIIEFNLLEYKSAKTGDVLPSVINQYITNKNIRDQLIKLNVNFSIYLQHLNLVCNMLLNQFTIQNGWNPFNISGVLIYLANFLIFIKIRNRGTRAVISHRDIELATHIHRNVLGSQTQILKPKFFMKFKQFQSQYHNSIFERQIEPNIFYSYQKIQQEWHRPSIKAENMIQLVLQDGPKIANDLITLIKVSNKTLNSSLRRLLIEEKIERYYDEEEREFVRLKKA